MWNMKRKFSKSLTSLRGGRWSSSVPCVSRPARRSNLHETWDCFARSRYGLEERFDKLSAAHLAYSTIARNDRWQQWFEPNFNLLKLISVFLILLVSLYTVSTVSAQGGTGYPTDDDVNRVAKKLYCPVCPNTPLDVCETKACEDWRAQIRDQLSEGWTEQQILDYFVAQYGERVLAEPQRKGFTSLVWLLPLIVVLIGLGIVYEILKSWRRRKTAAVVAAPMPEVSREILEKIEREIRELD